MLRFRVRVSGFVSNVVYLALYIFILMFPFFRWTRL